MLLAAHPLSTNNPEKFVNPYSYFKIVTECHYNISKYGFNANLTIISPYPFDVFVQHGT